MKLAVLAAAVAASFSIAAANAAVIVSWGGDYLTTTVNLPARATGTTSNGDFDGQADGFDSRRLVAYSETVARNPTIGAGYSGSSARFYGGLDLYEYDHAAAGAFPNHDDWNIENSSTVDRINLRIQPSGTPVGGGSITGATFGLYTWLKADFLNGFDAQQTVLDSLSVTLLDNAYSLRWVVKHAGQYYISQETESGGNATKSLDLSTQWSVYNPLTQIQFDAGSATFAPVILNDVEAVGVYYQQLNQPTSAQRLRITAVFAEGSPIPEPASALLLGFAGLALLRRRR